MEAFNINNMSQITFRIITTTLLSLPFPLSFLIIARINSINYLISISGIDQHTISFPYSLLFSSTKQHYALIPIHFLICSISISSLFYSLLTSLSSSAAENTCCYKRRPTKPYLCIAWMLLLILQFSVGLGIEGIIRSGRDNYDFGGAEKTSFGSCMATMFFLGLHETMLFWGRAVVKPVVEDTVFGGDFCHRHLVGYRWLEKTVMGLSYGGLWWWRLRREVGALVIVPEMKRDMMMSGGVEDLVGWIVYHLMVSVGVVRVMKWLLCFVLIRKKKDVIKISDEVV